MSDLARFLHHLGQWPEERFEDAWVRFMAWGVAQQFWPDGNHRTCFLALAVVAEETLGESFSLSVADMDRLREGSKAILQARPSLPGRPVFAMEELDDQHPYVGHFRSIVDRLHWEKSPTDLA